MVNFALQALQNICEKIKRSPLLPGIATARKKSDRGSFECGSMVGALGSPAYVEIGP
jgi:hypothetical protein